MEKRLALITGGTSGIGFGVAEALAGDCDLALAYAGNHDRANNAAGILQKTGTEVKLFPGKLSGYDDANRLVDDVIGRYGKSPEILINAAGRIKDGFFMQIDFPFHDELVAQHLLVTMALSQLVLKPMYGKRYGRIVNIGSISAFYAKRSQVSYSAAKAGLTGFTRTLAIEVAHRGITVNTVAPGLIRSPMTEGIVRYLESGSGKQIAKHIPSGFIGEPEDVGSLVAFLCSDKARYITGTVIPVDGGRSLGDTGI